jgi:hypothetical protein
MPTRQTAASQTRGCDQSPHSVATSTMPDRNIGGTTTVKNLVARMVGTPKCSPTLSGVKDRQVG